MKKGFVFLCLLFSVFVLFADDLRDVVVIVKPKYPEKILTFLEDTGTYFKKAGYDDISKLFKNAKEGVFGSGFFIRGTDGKFYVLTNQHVAAYGESLTLEIVDIDGNVKKIENCTVIAANEELDLAIAAVSDPLKVPFALEFAKKTPRDGDDVWSAGYPGFGGEPLWQLGKGVVSNSKARIPAMVNPKKSFFIQHSAPIDSGNSGGPLLVRSGAKYEVVGMNSAKAVFRQTTNFAIPASTIIEFVNTGLSQKSGGTEDLIVSAKEFSEMCSKFDPAEKKEEAVKRIANMALFISEDYAISQGQEALKNALTKAPTAIRNEILAAAVLSNPINALKTAIAYEIYKTLDPEGNDYKPEQPITLENLKKNANGYEIPLVNKDNTANFLWKEHLKSWKINAFALNEAVKENTAAAEGTKEKTKKEKKAKKRSSGEFSFSMDPKRRLSLSYIGFKVPRGLSSGALIEISAFNFNYFETAVSLTLQQTPEKDMPSFSFFDRFRSNKDEKRTTNFQLKTGIHITLQLPMDFYGKVTVVPQLTAGAGSMGFLILGTDIYARLGFNLQFIPGAFENIAVEAGYLVDFDNLILSKTKPAYHGFRIGISYRF